MPLFTCRNTKIMVASIQISKSEVNCAISAMTAASQPPTPQSLMQTKAKTKRKRKHNRGKHTQPLPPPLQGEAKAKASNHRENQPEAAQPPQPPLGNTPNNAQISANDGGKRRRRRGKKKRNPALVSNEPNKPNKPALKRPREEDSEEEVNDLYTSKRLRDEDGKEKVNAKRLREDALNTKATSRSKAMSMPTNRPEFPLCSMTPHFPNSTYFQYRTTPNRAARAYYQGLQDQQASKLHRANLKAQRDFPSTLEAIASLPDGATDSEHTPISLADSIPTSGQSTPEPAVQIPSDINVSLFGLQAKTRVETPDIWEISGSSPTELDSDLSSYVSRRP